MVLFVTAGTPAFADTGDVAATSWSVVAESNTATDTGTQITEATTTTIYITKQTSEITDALENLVAAAAIYPSRAAYQGNNKRMYEAMLDYLYYKTATDHEVFLNQFVDNLKEQDADLLKLNYNIYAASMFDALDEILGTWTTSAETKETNTSNALYTVETATHNNSTFTIYRIKENIGIKSVTFHLSDKTTHACRRTQCDTVAFNNDTQQVTEIFATTTTEENLHLSF